MLRFSVENRPSWADFDPSNGRLSGAPAEGDVRRWEGVRISVSDGRAQVSLSPFVIDVRAAGTFLGNATLSWSPPTQRADGSPIGGLAGFRVVYGTQPGRYDYSVRIDNPGITRYMVEDLYPATWYFAVTAISADGLESPPSREVSKRIDG